MARRYTGSCHCGSVRYEAEIDLSQGTFKCNCSICTKKRFWGVGTIPGTFKLVQGEADLAAYQPYSVHHMFCKQCGIHVYGTAQLPGETEPTYVACISALDDLDIDELMAAPIAYFDGANDNFQSPPAEIRHL